MKPIVLMILDGWGYREAPRGNAVAQARTPHFDRLWASYPHTLLQASGEAVGLPAGVMGNSEVGHLNIGAGRVVYQDLTRINRAIADGEFARHPQWREIAAVSQQRGSTVHVMGLLSDGGVHSHLAHLLSVLAALRDAGVAVVRVHAFLDGRDTSPTGGRGYLLQLNDAARRLGNVRIASVMGRYYAMDRDRRWERTHAAYDALVLGQGERITDPLMAIEASYQQGVTDEFVVPKVVVEAGAPIGCLRDGDSVVFINFRGDRARQMTQALMQPDFSGFARSSWPRLERFLCMTSYHREYPYPVLFPPQVLTNLFGEIVSRAGLHQLRIAETEKYAHVTFFFNGGRDQAAPGEDHILIQSPQDVPTYDHRPEMSARELTERVVSELAAQRHDVVILNYANVDMVGHTGVQSAAVRAVETVDTCMGQVVAAVQARGGALLITADHGNAEEMLTADGQPQTAHTTNLVPCILVGPPSLARPLRDGGRLADLAPTLLHLLGVAIPAEMTGRPLW